jgi:hypothetical protein
VTQLSIADALSDILRPASAVTNLFAFVLRTNNSAVLTLSADFPIWTFTVRKCNASVLYRL